MTSGRAAVWGLASAGILLAAGFALLASGGRESGGRPDAAPRSGDLSPDQAADRARRAETYARWVLSRAAADGETVAAALRAVQGVLAETGDRTPEEKEVAARLKGVRMDLAARRRAALDRLWVSFRRNHALRDWSGARRDLARILRITHDPRDADHRQARRLLDRISAR